MKKEPKICPVNLLIIFGLRAYTNKLPSILTYCLDPPCYYIIAKIKNKKTSTFFTDFSKQIELTRLVRKKKLNKLVKYKYMCVVF